MCGESREHGRRIREAIMCMWGMGVAHRRRREPSAGRGPPAEAARSPTGGAGEKHEAPEGIQKRFQKRFLSLTAMTDCVRRCIGNRQESAPHAVCGGGGTEREWARARARSGSAAAAQRAGACARSRARVCVMNLVPIRGLGPWALAAAVDVVHREVRLAVPVYRLAAAADRSSSAAPPPLLLCSPLLPSGS